MQGQDRVETNPPQTSPLAMPSGVTPALTRILRELHPPQALIAMPSGKLRHELIAAQHPGRMVRPLPKIRPLCLFVI